MKSSLAPCLKVHSTTSAGLYCDVEVSDIEVSQPCTDKEEIVLNCTEHLDL